MKKIEKFFAILFLLEFLVLIAPITDGSADTCLLVEAMKKPFREPEEYIVPNRIQIGKVAQGINQIILSDENNIKLAKRINRFYKESIGNFFSKYNKDNKTIKKIAKKLV